MRITPPLLLEQGKKTKSVLARKSKSISRLQKKGCTVKCTRKLVKRCESSVYVPEEKLFHQLETNAELVIAVGQGRDGLDL